MANHGPLYDEFHAQAGHPHNGAQHDSFHAQRPDALPHGALIDDDYRAANGETPGGHGPHWDDFAWKAMPLIHGAHWDTDFDRPAVLDGVDHGTWLDVFRGGAHQVRANVDGKDLEAEVIDCQGDHVKLRKAGGEIVEAALSQLRAFRGPAPSRTGIRSADVGHTDAPITPSTADAPSAHDATASGGHLRKTLDELNDITKTMHRAFGIAKPAPVIHGITSHHNLPDGHPHKIYRCSSCGAQGRHDTRHKPSCKLAAGPLFNQQKHNLGKTTAEQLDVLKDVDATETALQTDGSGGTVGHRKACPRGGNAPCGAEKNGSCTICKAQVHDHEAIGKTGPVLADVLKSIEGLVA